jgi:hypothetical protein
MSLVTVFVCETVSAVWPLGKRIRRSRLLRHSLSISAEAGLLGLLESRVQTKGDEVQGCAMLE